MKKLFICLLCAFSVSGLSAQSKLDAYTKLYLNSRANNAVEETVGNRQNMIFPKSVTVNAQETVLTIVTLDDENEVPDLQYADAEIEAQIGKLIIVRVPVDNIVEMSEASEIKMVQVERPMAVKNSNSRTATLQDKVNETLDLAGNALTGKDVVVGVIDTGIDYNNVNFKDADGKSRVKYVINGTRTFTSAAQIAVLSTDYVGSNHGSHTTGTAAGSYTDNGLQGMAPEAELALCGMNNSFTDANVLLACKDIIDYATSVGKPIVINMSIGVNDGAHDGSNAICLGFDEMAKAGVIFVVAAGNEGQMQIYLNKKFTAESNSVSTIISDISNYGNAYYNGLQVYSFSNKLPAIQFFVADASTNDILCKSDTITQTMSVDGWSLNSTSSYSSFSKYYSTYGNYTANIALTTSVADDKSYYEVQIIGRSIQTSKYYIGMTLIGEDGEEIHAWGSDSYTEFLRNRSNEFTAGNATKSINSMACGDNVISVGAYTASNSYTSIDGNTYNYSSYYPKNVIAPFSSYGIDMRNVSRPDVCAPGICVVSSYNSYNSSSTSSSIVSRVTGSNGRTYSWGVSNGTSMATPIVTGIIATWLQYKPTLTVAGVREILKNTANKDSYVLADDSVKWGAGKIDAYAGLQYLMTSGVNDVEVMQNNVLVYPNPNGGQFKVLTQGEYNGATLNVYNIAGSRVYTTRIDAAQTAVDVDLSGNLNSGIYIVEIVGEKVNYSTRMVIK